MSQYFDYFVCSEIIMERWGQAVLEFDEEKLHLCQRMMPAFSGFKNVSFDMVGMLAKCDAEQVGDPYEYIADFELAKSLNDEEGPWILRLKNVVVDAVAELDVDEKVIERWIRYQVEFSGVSVDESTHDYFYESAESLSVICKLALKRQLPVYCCFYG